MSSTKSLLPRSSSCASLNTASSINSSVTFSNMVRCPFLYSSKLSTNRTNLSFLCPISSIVSDYSPSNRQALLNSVVCSLTGSLG